MNRICFFASALSILAAVSTSACTAPVSSNDDDVSTSEAAVTSVHLEKSRIEVLLDQVNEVSSIGGECLIKSTRFRITYENATLPTGTKVTLHVGENASDQAWIGDGYGWGSWSELHWQNIRDLPMTHASSKWEMEVEGKPYARNYEDYGAWAIGGDLSSFQVYGATIQFVFRIELPDGTVLWDNRLHQDYWVNGNGPACPSGTTNGFVSRAVWGPY